MDENNLVYQGRLHYVIFFWPVLLLLAAMYLAFGFGAEQVAVQKLSYVLGAFALIWGTVTLLQYICSSLNIKNKQVILSTGVLVHQTIDIPMNKIESIDIRQSVLGSLLNYGSLVITGTGGTRQYVNYLSSPLTCRRYIEQMMHG